jgi:cobalt/nickel transport system permease protein
VGAGHTHPLHVHEHSRTHHLPAHVKVVATLTTAGLVATAPRDDVIAFAGAAVVLAAVARASRVPGRFLVSRLAVTAPFLIAALLLPFVASGPRVDVVGVPLAVEGLWGALGLVSRTLLGATASLLLVATTEVPALLRGLERLRVPPVLTQIAATMLRYLEVIVGEVGRQRRAMTARGYDPRWLWQLGPLTAGLGVLFVRAYERGERVHAAMLARGFTGRMPVLVAERPATAADWAVAMAVPGLVAVARTVGAVVGGAEAWA